MGISIKINIQSKYLILMSILIIISSLLFAPWSPLSIYENGTDGYLNTDTIICFEEPPCPDTIVFTLEVSEEVYHLRDAITEEYIEDITTYGDYIEGSHVSVIGDIIVVVDYSGVPHDVINVEAIHFYGSGFEMFPFDTLAIVILLGVGLAVSIIILSKFGYLRFLR